MTLVSVLKPTSQESRPGMPMPPLMPLDVQRPRMYSVTSRMGLLNALHRGELDRLVLGDRAGGGVAHAQLDRRRDRRQRQGDQEAEAVMAIAPAAKHAHRVDGGHEESRDHVRREDHVRRLVGDALC